ncbi:MAG: class I SAM-dependent methyltransferase, partial [Candidatus Marinimicrobia bacterium]|nr:class I SAM-dependent methyltransferase [Candidatus Neomarinimicrobiota bacterium]
MNNYIVRRNDRIYRKALKREMAIWERSARELNPANEVANKEETISENNPILLKYFNKKLGIKNKSEFGWVDFIVNNYEPVQTSLSLGSGSEKFEKAFLERGFTKNFNTIDIVSIEGPNNYDNDLNFIKFENNKYDFILCKSILHHIINLEYLLYQVNSALKENGILVVYEYIGEDKQQWNDKKINILNYKLKDEFGEGFPFLKIDKHPMKNIS